MLRGRGLPKRPVHLLEDLGQCQRRRRPGSAAADPAQTAQMCLQISQQQRGVHAFAGNIGRSHRDRRLFEADEASMRFPTFITGIGLARTEAGDPQLKIAAHMKDNKPKVQPLRRGEWHYCIWPGSRPLPP